MVSSSLIASLRLSDEKCQSLIGFFDDNSRKRFPVFISQSVTEYASSWAEPLQEPP